MDTVNIDIYVNKPRNTCHRPGGTNSTGRPDYWESAWGKMLIDPTLQVPGSDLRKTFFRRFRVPYVLYNRLVVWAKSWCEKRLCDASGRNIVPTELKVLGYLRIVGRGVCFDDIQELSYISTSTMHRFFHTFSKKGREQLFPVHVIFPKTTEEIGVIEAAYASLGIPGACGSMDVVHISLGACPTTIKNVCVGKEGYPTLAYNVICDHQGRCITLIPGSYGSVNDQTIVKSDQAVQKIRTEDFYKNYTYEMKDRDGNPQFHQGFYS